MPDALLFRFAQEELVYLMHALDIAAIPGFDTQLMRNLDESQQMIFLSVADRTLRAHGTIHWRSKEERDVDPLIASVLRDCAYPRYNLFVDILQEGGLSSKLLYIFAKHAVIEHCESEPGVQQLMVMPTLEDVTKRLRDLLVIPEMELNLLPVGQVSQERLNSVFAAVSSDLAGITSILATELPPETAHSLAIALQTPQAVQHLALWSGDPNVERIHEPDAALTIVQGDTYLFLLWSEKPNISQVEVLSATPTQAWEYINRLLQAVPASGTQET